MMSFDWPPLLNVPISFFLPPPSLLITAAVLAFVSNGFWWITFILQKSLGDGCAHFNWFSNSLSLYEPTRGKLPRISLSLSRSPFVSPSPMLSIYLTNLSVSPLPLTFAYLAPLFLSRTEKKGWRSLSSLNIPRNALLFFLLKLWSSLYTWKS